MLKSTSALPATAQHGAQLLALLAAASCRAPAGSGSKGGGKLGRAHKQQRLRSRRDWLLGRCWGELGNGGREDWSGAADVLALHGEGSLQPEVGATSCS